MKKIKVSKGVRLFNYVVNKKEVLVKEEDIIELVNLWKEYEIEYFDKHFHLDGSESWIEKQINDNYDELHFFEEAIVGTKTNLFIVKNNYFEMEN